MRYFAPVLINIPGCRIDLDFIAVVFAETEKGCNIIGDFS